MAKVKQTIEPWRNAIVRYAVEPIDSLIPHPQNPKHHPPEQRDALVGSLNEFGIVAPVLINERSNRMLDGHKRLIEAQNRGQPTFPVLYVDVPIEKEGAFLASFDPIGWMASNDDALIAELLESAHVEDSMLSEFLETLRQPEPKQLNDDDADLTPPVEPITKPGDLWLLGDHRLLCGDATNAEDVARLMGGKAAQMVFADPPYGIGLDTQYSDMHSGLHRVNDYRAVTGDDHPFDAAPLIALLNDVSEQFWWGADYYRQTIPAGGSWIVWDKRDNDQGMALDALLGAAFELCWSRQSHKREIARVLWSGHHGMQQEDSKVRLHPTQKPTALATWFFERWGRVGDSVLDPFAGSGSTLVAAEQTGRVAYLLEIEPAYCDVTVRRWEHLTGRKATLEKTDTTVRQNGTLVQTHT